MRTFGIAMMLMVMAFTGGPADALTLGIDGQLFFSGGALEIRNESASSGYSNYLYLRTPLAGDQFLFVDNGNQLVTFQESRLASFGIGLGDELLFMIRPDNGAAAYFTGATTRNPDGRHHANVADLGNGAFMVGFEDFYGGGDQDFNDAVFSVLGGGFPDPQVQTVPEPVTLVLFVLGGAGLGFLRLRK